MSPADDPSALPVRTPGKGRIHRSAEQAISALDRRACAPPGGGFAHEGHIYRGPICPPTAPRREQESVARRVGVSGLLPAVETVATWGAGCCGLVATGR